MAIESTRKIEARAKLDARMAELSESQLLGLVLQFWNADSDDLPGLSIRVASVRELEKRNGSEFVELLYDQLEAAAE